MKLTLEHISPYYPFKLKGAVEWEHKQETHIVELYGIDLQYIRIENPYGGFDYCDIGDFKPALIPMKELLEDKWYRIWRQEIDTESLGVLVEEPYDAEFFQSYKLSYITTKQLFENHFDIFGLIDAELAIKKTITMLQHRESEYFNSGDYYLIFTNLNRYFVTKCHWHNGSWFSDEGLKYKMTSVLSVSCGELKDKEVRYKDTSLKGKITKFISPDGVGVNWLQGGEYKKYGLPNYFNKFENLEL